MKNMILIGAIAVAVGLTHQSVFAKQETKQNLQLPAASIQHFDIDAGAGDLSVKGVNGIDTISVVAKIKGRELDEYEYSLYLTQEGNKAVLYAHIENRNFSNTYIDLEVTAPSQLALEIADRSGDLQVENMQGGLRIDDRSGDIEVREIIGDLNIRDRSGDIDIYTVTGNVEVEDRSGDLVLITATGNVNLQDGSGDVTIKTVNGNVELKDGSGDIDILNVSGKVGVEDGAGDIHIDGAESFSLYRDGKGDVDLANVRNE